SSWAFLPAFSASSNGTPMTTAATTSDTSVAIGLRPRPPPTVRPAETFDSWIGGRPEPAGCWGGGGVNVGVGAGGGAVAWGASAAGNPSGVHDGTPSGVGPGIGVDAPLPTSLPKASRSATE